MLILQSIFSTYNLKTISKANIQTHVYPNDTSPKSIVSWTHWHIHVQYNLPSSMLKCFSYSNQNFTHLREKDITSMQYEIFTLSLKISNTYTCTCYEILYVHVYRCMSMDIRYIFWAIYLLLTWDIRYLPDITGRYLPEVLDIYQIFTYDPCYCGRGS